MHNAIGPGSAVTLSPIGVSEGATDYFTVNKIYKVRAISSSGKFLVVPCNDTPAIRKYVNDELRHGRLTDWPTRWFTKVNNKRLVLR